MSEVKRARSPSPSSGAGKKSRTEMEEVALFIFRRDLRVTDNTGLQALCDEAAKRSINVLPAFFFNPLQCDKKKNKYFGDNFFQFFCESLVDLDGPSQLNKHLVCLRGSDNECLAQIRKCGYDVTVLGYNEDYTPFAQARDQLLRSYTDDKNITRVVGHQDYSLRPLDAVVTGAEKPYGVFTPFSNKFLAEEASKISKPLKTQVKRIQSMLVGNPKKYFEQYLVDPAKMYTPNKQLIESGGRSSGLKRLAGVKNMKKYGNVRDDIAGDKTSHLSAHMKCGTVSVREVWQAAMQHLGRQHPFTRQLIWREFYAMLLFHHPRLVQGQLNAFIGEKSIVKSSKPQRNAPFQEKYDNFKWNWKPEHFEAFKAGKTGVPLVDAAVRCVTATGWCHNRCRLTISNFAVKTLAIDWRECERWFATVAVDYDVANNNGGWLWSSGQGADPQPFFRTFNAFRQSERFDPDCEFIFKWVPELKEVPPSVVHKWADYCAKKSKKGAKKSPATKGKRQTTSAGKKGKGEDDDYKTSYPAPIVDIKAATQAVINSFRK